MKNLFLTFFLYFLCPCYSYGQTYIDYKNENEKLYPILCKIKSDSVHRVCITFLKKYKILDDYSKLSSFCKNLKRKCEKENSKDLSARISIIELTGKLKNSKVSSETCTIEFKKMFESFYNENNYSAALESLFELAQMHFFNKNQIEALKILFFAEKFAINQNLTNDIAYQGIVFKLGQTLLDIDKFNSSISFLKKSINSKKSNSMDLQIAYNGIGIGLQKLNKFRESNQYFEKGSKIALCEKNLVFNNIILGNIAYNFYKLNQLEKAFKNANIDKGSSLKNQLWSNAIGALHLLIKIELKRNNLTHSKILLDSMHVLMSKIPLENYRAQKRLYESSYQYFKKINNSEKALNSYQKFIYFSSLFENKFNKDKISMLEINANSEILANEIKEIEKQKKLKLIFFVVICVTIILILIFTIRFFNRKLIKTEKDKLKIEEENQKNVLKIDDLKIQLLEYLELIQLNNWNVKLKHDDIVALKNYHLSKKEQLIEFKKLFIKNYPELINKINKSFNLSEAELRLIMLHKLQLSNKKIAETLLISTDGVKKANYRLYKKLKINSLQELSAILNN